MSFTYSTIPSPPIFGKKQQQGVSPADNQVAVYVSSADEFRPLAISSILPSNVALEDAANIFTEQQQINVSGTPRTIGTTTALEIINEATKQGIDCYSFGDQQFNIRQLRAKGTVTTPTAVVLNDTIMLLSGLGYDGTGFDTARVQIRGTASENWTNLVNGAYLSFRTTENGGIVMIENLRVLGNGGIGLNATKKIFLDGVNGTGDTFIYESAANTLQIYAGGTLQAQLSSDVETPVTLNSGNKAGLLTTSDLGSSFWTVAKNTTDSKVYLYVNDAGTIKKVELT